MSERNIQTKMFSTRSESRSVGFVSSRSGGYGYSYFGYSYTDGLFTYGRSYRS